MSYLLGPRGAGWCESTRPSVAERSGRSLAETHLRAGETPWPLGNILRSSQPSVASWMDEIRTADWTGGCCRAARESRLLADAFQQATGRSATSSGPVSRPDLIHPGCNGRRPEPA